MPHMANAVWTDLLNYTQTTIQGLNLLFGPTPTALPSNQVYKRKVYSDRSVLFPCIICCLGKNEEMAPGGTEAIEVIYPILVVHLFASNQDLTPNNDPLLWRQLIIDAFIDLPVPSIATASVNDCRVDTSVPIDPAAFETANLDVGALSLNFETARTRNRAG